MEKTIYIKGIQAKLILERGFGLEVYQTIRNAIDVYEEVKVRTSFDHDLITKGRKSYGMIRVARKNVVLYLALDPKKLPAKYSVIDASKFVTYAKYPTKIVINNKKKVKQAIELLDKAVLANATLIEKEPVNYSEIFYERSFAQCYKDGLIKEYVIKNSSINKNVETIEETEEEKEMHKVTFTAKLLYCAMNQADELFIITNVDNWSFDKAIKMEKIDENTFKAIEFFEKGTRLEFKVCRKQDWEDVEKGIWKEEIVNHHYVIVNNDLEVEDLIHNFRTK